jgi:hypothetical protein
MVPHLPQLWKLGSPTNSTEGNRTELRYLKAAYFGLLYGRPEFESRLGTPQEALYRASAMRRTRAALDEYYTVYKILYVCSANVKNKQKEWQHATKPLKLLYFGLIFVFF